MEVKLSTLIVITMLAIHGVFTLPAKTPTDDDAEIIVVPLGPQRPIYRTPDYDNFQGLVDTGFLGNSNFYPPAPSYYTPQQSYYPWNWNFRGFFDSFEDVLRRMRNQIPNPWSQSPVGHGPGFIDVLNGKDGNTTSITKIIDGHKVTINDTTYTRNTEFGQSVFKVRVIDVKPLDGDVAKPPENGTPNPDAEDAGAAEEATTSVNIETKISGDDDKDAETTVKPESEKPEREPLGESDESNAILTTDIDDADAAAPESFEHQSHHNYMHQSILNHNYPESAEIKIRPPTWESTEDGEDSFEGNHIHNDLLFDEEIAPIDLSNDLNVNYVNQEDLPINPDAEVFPVEDFHSPREVIAAAASMPSSASSMSRLIPRFESIKIKK